MHFVKLLVPTNPGRKEVNRMVALEFFIEICYTFTVVVIVVGAVVAWGSMNFKDVFS